MCLQAVDTALEELPAAGNRNVPRRQPDDWAADEFAGDAGGLSFPPTEFVERPSLAASEY